MLRRRGKEPVPAARLGPRWQPYVDQASALRDDFASLLSGTAAGPLQERLAELAAAMERQVEACIDAAGRADRLEATVARLRPDEITNAYKEAKRARQREGASAPPALEAREASLAAQHATVHRLLNTLDTTEDRLRLVEVRLRELLVRGAEVGLGVDVDAVERVAHDLDEVSGELAALRSALDDLAAP